MNNNKKIERLESLILNDASVGMYLVNEINTWDSSLDYLQVFLMHEFNEFMCGDPLEIANKIFYGDFNPNHEFFRFDAYGNLKSLNEYDLRDEIIDYSSEIAVRVVELYEGGHLDYLDDEIIEILNNEC